MSASITSSILFGIIERWLVQVTSIIWVFRGDPTIPLYDIFSPGTEVLFSKLVIRLKWVIALNWEMYSEADFDDPWLSISDAFWSNAFPSSHEGESYHGRMTPSKPTILTSQLFIKGWSPRDGGCSVALAYYGLCSRWQNNIGSLQTRHFSFP